MTTDYDVVTVKPFLRLTNPKLTDLENLIWEPWQDLALVACLRGETRNGKIVFVDIPKETGVKKEVVFHDAREYMEGIACVQDIVTAIEKLAEELEIETDFTPEDEVALTVVTTTDGTNGASIITLQSVVEKLCSKFGRYYIIPSSRHEVIVLPEREKGDLTEWALNEIIRMVNVTEVPLSDWLGDHVYLCENGEISQINTPVGVIKE